MRTRPPSEVPGERPGHADSPRQDTQRPTHADHADAGGQESANARLERTQRAADTVPPAGALPAPGERHRDPPLPEVGRQSQRPAQHGRAQDRPGARDVESFRSAEGEGGGLEGLGDRRVDALHAGDAAKRRTSRSTSSARRDTGVGAEEPPPERRRP